MKINNYRWQQQQERKQKHKAVKKIKLNHAREKPTPATEELEYIKKLMSGEDVGDFKTKEELEREKLRKIAEDQLQRDWKQIGSTGMWIDDPSRVVTLSDYFNSINGNPYFK